MRCWGQGPRRSPRDASDRDDGPRRRLGRTYRVCFFFQAEDGIRAVAVTGVQTCALPIYRLATEVLHLSHLRALMGLSMGGMQAFEWGVAYPDFMDLLIPMVGSPQSTSYDKLLWRAQIDAMELDPAWNHGHPTGPMRSEEHTSELQSRLHLVCRLLLAK